jgi:hypothetical protein
MVFEDVQAIMPAAFGSHARASQLRQSIDVESFQAEKRFNLAPHAIAPGLRSENPNSQLYANATSGRIKSFGQDQRVRGRATQDRGSKVTHQHDLALGHARAGRDDCCSNRLGAKVQTHAAGE